MENVFWASFYDELEKFAASALAPAQVEKLKQKQRRQDAIAGALLGAHTGIIPGALAMDTIKNKNTAALLGLGSVAAGTLAGISLGKKYMPKLREYFSGSEYDPGLIIAAQYEDSKKGSEKKASDGLGVGGLLGKKLRSDREKKASIRYMSLNDAFENIFWRFA